MVEARGVEPLSENISAQLSPGADGCLHFLTQAPAVGLKSLVASLCMGGAKLSRLMFTTSRRSVPGRGPPGRNGHCLSSDENVFVVVL